MSREDEKEVTRDDESSGAEGDHSSADTAVSEDDTVSEESEELDAAADSFLEVEQEIDTMAEGMQLRGQAIDVAQIPAHEVPDGFPYKIGTTDALALTLEIDQTEGKTVTTYFEWPGQGGDDRLAKLMDLHGVPLDRFAELHGEDLLLAVKDGHFVPVLPKDGIRGDDRAYFGVVGGFAFLLFPLIAWMFGVTDMIGSSLFFFLFVLVHLIVLPVSIYLDAWDLRTTTNWTGGPLFWAFFAMIPGLNVMIVAAYLILRGNAEPII